MKEAVELLEQVIQIYKTTLAADHPDRLASQHALALANWNNRQAKEAVELMEEVVKTYQLKWDEGHPDRILSEQWLAYFLKRN